MHTELCFNKLENNPNRNQIRRIKLIEEIFEAESGELVFLHLA
jgi:hypothetical protein